jgi:hypothetical protein
MHHPPLVSTVQAHRGLADRLAGVGHRQRSDPPDDLAQVLAVEQLHHQEQVLACLPRVVGVNEVGVVQLAEGGHLALEAGPIRRVGRQPLRQDLEGDVALQPAVPGQVDLAHAPLAQRAQELVLAEGGRRGVRRRGGIDRRVRQRVLQDAPNDARRQAGDGIHLRADPVRLAQGQGRRVGSILRQVLEPRLAFGVRFQPPGHGVRLGLGQQAAVQSEQVVVRRNPTVACHE